MSKIPGDTFSPMVALAEHSFTLRDEEPMQATHESPRGKMAHSLAPKDEQSFPGRACVCTY